MTGADLPITLLLWLAAAAPLAAVFVLLVGLRWKASSAASVGYFLAAFIALLLFEASLGTVALQSVKGVWDALFIAYVIAPALLLYEISDEAGAFGAIRRGIEAITPNDLLHILAFGWVFPFFLQSITGFGAPIAVAAPLLLAMGLKPLWAVAIPIIGHAWGKTFGTLGVAWEALTQVADAADSLLAITVTGIMLVLADLLAGFTIAWLYGRWRGVREALPALLVVGVIHAAGQLAIAPIAPNLANVIPGTLALAAIIFLARRVYNQPSAVADSPLMRQGDPGTPVTGGGEPGPIPERSMPLGIAFGPYLILIGLILAVELIPFLNEPLSSVRFGLSFPSLATGYGIVTNATEAYSEFSPLTHPGTFLLVSSLIAFWYFRSRGYIGAGRVDEIAIDTVKTSIPTVMALFAFLPLALVLQGAGMVLELARGIAQVASGPVYALLSPVIGSLGGFLTGSALSSNILFGALQQQAAEALGLHPAFVLAAQTAGASIGASIAISTVLLGLGAVGAGSEQTGNAIRKMLPYAAVTILAIGLIAIIGVLVFPVGANGTGG
ncbi:MAG: L-lactate permease [Alphaproteobacteria bacterium]